MKNMKSEVNSRKNHLTKTFAELLYRTAKFIYDIDLEMINSIRNQRIDDIAENLTLQWKKEYQTAEEQFKVKLSRKEKWLKKLKL